MRATFVMPPDPCLLWSDGMLQSMPGRPFTDLTGERIGVIVGAVRDEDGTIRVTVDCEDTSANAEMIGGDEVEHVSLYNGRMRRDGL